nr:reverse transcriptase domain-containing protein [Tanacetum cinerariifolium]
MKGFQRIFSRDSGSLPGKPISASHDYKWILARQGSHFGLLTDASEILGKLNIGLAYKKGLSDTPQVAAEILKAAIGALAQEKQSLLLKNVMTKDHPHEGRKRCRKAKIVQENIGSQSQRGKSRVLRTTCPNHGTLGNANVVSHVQFHTYGKRKSVVRRPSKESIDRYDNLKEAFLENYLQQKKCIKDPVEIHNIKQRDGESMEEFMKRQRRQKGGNLRKGKIAGNTNGKEDGMEGPMIIKAKMRGHFVHRMYIDGCSLQKSCMKTASTDSAQRTLNINMDEFHGCKVTISIKRNNREARSKENLGSAVYSSRNAKIPNEHMLNIREGCLPVRQKKRGQAPERNKTIYEEVEKLVYASIMKEVHYHSWLSNPVMVKNSWRMCVDLKDLNKSCPKDGYSLPEIDWKDVRYQSSGSLETCT